MFKTPDIPRDELCQEVNPKLFQYFRLTMLKYTGNLATPNWTEAEVVQWLDTKMYKYIHEHTLD
jgi:hypothetical protein